jgi:hypothetical protein
MVIVLVAARVGVTGVAKQAVVVLAVVSTSVGIFKR